MTSAWSAAVTFAGLRTEDNIKISAQCCGRSSVQCCTKGKSVKICFDDVIHVIAARRVKELLEGKVL
jgi:hypothetical protein